MRIAIAGLVILATLGSTATLTAQDSTRSKGLPRNGDLAEIPEWYAKIPKEENHLLVTATALSPDMDVAVEIAELSARRRLAEGLQARVKTFSSATIKQAGLSARNNLGQTLERMMTAEVDQFVRNARVREQEVKREEGQFRAWILMEMPIGPIAEDMIRKIKANNALYTKVKDAKAWAELISTGLKGGSIANDDQSGNP